MTSCYGHQCAMRYPMYGSTAVRYLSQPRPEPDEAHRVGAATRPRTRHSHRHDHSYPALILPVRARVLQLHDRIIGSSTIVLVLFTIPRWRGCVEAVREIVVGHTTGPRTGKDIWPF